MKVGKREEQQIKRDRRKDMESLPKCNTDPGVNSITDARLKVILWSLLIIVSSQ